MEQINKLLNKLQKYIHSLLFRKSVRKFKKKIATNNAVSIKVGVIQAFSLVIVLITCLIMVLFFIGSKRSIAQLSERVSQEIVNQLIQKTHQFLTLPAKQTQSVANYASSVYDNVGKTGMVLEHEKTWQVMWSQLMMWESVQTMFVADEHGNYVQVRRSPKFATRLIDRVTDPEQPNEKWLYRNQKYDITSDMERVPTFDPRVRPWYKGTGKNPKIYWTDVFVFTTAKTPGISASYPLLVDGVQKGVAAFNIPLVELSELLSKQRISENAQVLVLDPNDRILAYEDINMLLKGEGKALRLINIEEFHIDWVKNAYKAYKNQTQKRFIYSEGFLNPYQRYVTQLIDFPTTLDWKVLIVIPEMDILSKFYEIVIQTAAISLLILFIGIFWIYFFARQITSPIANMTEQLYKVRSLKLDDIHFVNSRFTELQSMRRSMEKMIQGLHSFHRYVPSALVQQLIDLGKEAVIEVEEAEVVIFFSDIVGFTAIAEEMDNQELIHFLSVYLKEVSNIIQVNLGTIDKFIGDAVMAFWGAPVHYPNSPYLTCVSALQCIKKIDELNISWDYDPNMKTRIGLHVGTTLVGNIGCDERMNYTIIGDNVNLAARLEQLNKRYGTEIIVSDSLRQSVAKFFQFRLLDIVVVKGKTQSVRIYELLAEKNDVLSEEKAYFVEKYEEGMEQYLAQNWEAAITIFQDLKTFAPDDLSVQVLLDRCIEYHNTINLDLGENWDGAVVLDSK